jgi:hypothetical protein
MNLAGALSQHCGPIIDRHHELRARGLRPIPARIAPPACRLAYTRPPPPERAVRCAAQRPELTPTEACCTPELTGPSGCSVLRSAPKQQRPELLPPPRLGGLGGAAPGRWRLPGRRPGGRAGHRRSGRDDRGLDEVAQVIRPVPGSAIDTALPRPQRDPSAGPTALPTRDRALTPGEMETLRLVAVSAGNVETTADLGMSPEQRRRARVRPCATSTYATAQRSARLRVPIAEHSTHGPVPADEPPMTSVRRRRARDGPPDDQRLHGVGAFEGV